MNSSLPEGSGGRRRRKPLGPRAGGTVGAGGRWTPASRPRQLPFSLSPIAAAWGGVALGSRGGVGAGVWENKGALEWVRGRLQSQVPFPPGGAGAAQAPAALTRSWGRGRRWGQACVRVPGSVGEAWSLHPGKDTGAGRVAGLLGWGSGASCGSRPVQHRSQDGVLCAPGLGS